jgi:hypothetical protein
MSDVETTEPRTTAGDKEAPKPGEPGFVPQGPNDPGYEPPLIVPALDGKGGTVYQVGDQEFGTYEEAAESVKPAEAAEGDTEAEDEPDPADEQPEA